MSQPDFEKLKRMYLLEPYFHSRINQKYAEFSRAIEDRQLDVWKDLILFGVCLLEKYRDENDRLQLKRLDPLYIRKRQSKSKIEYVQNVPNSPEIILSENEIIEISMKMKL